MKVSLRWLRDYVDITTPIEELAERLTMAGLEVSEIHVIGSNWDNIVVGRLVSVDAHPDADRLRLTTVDLGEKKITVVCGAPNLMVGDKVAFADLGAQLINPYTGELTELKSAKIRGVLSEGMVCSEKELGISDSHEGILILSPDAPIGAPLSEYLGDVILDMDITPNRPDCLSIIGIAREIAALTDSKLHIPEIDYKELEAPVDSFAVIEILEPELCPRYCASVLSGVKIGPSPQWLQQRLLACGMRPISNIVDVTNYVMLEYGQPLHAFDYEGIRGKKIIVRRANTNEALTTLDGVDRNLDPGMLVIADAGRAVAVAGVMGGADAEVTSGTTTVLIEAANFNQAVVHSGSIALKLSSEASLRFEKGLSRDLPVPALRRATQLMMELSGAEAAQGIIDIYPGQKKVEPILLSTGEIKRILGVEVRNEEMVAMLTRFGFNSNPTDVKLQVLVDVPWWRTDVSCAADLVEEIARIIGYDNIPATMLSSPLPVAEPAPMLTLKRELGSLLVSCGLQEVITYSMTSLNAIKKLSPKLDLIGPEPLKAANPMSRELEYLRTTLRASLLSTLARNQRHQQKGMGLFEIGRVFIPQRGDLPQEKEMLCAVLGGLQNELFWRGDTGDVDFYVAKGVAEAVLSGLRLTANFMPGNDESLYPGKNADIFIDLLHNYPGDKVGVIGELHPAVVDAFELTETAHIVEFDVEKLLTYANTSYSYQQIPRYPGTIRDIALVVDERITFQQVHSIVTSFPLVSQVALFDLYSGKQVPAGKKSLAFRIIYQSNERTLSDKEVDDIQQRILDRLAKDLGATLRG